MQGYADSGDANEDTRIRIMGEYITAHPEEQVCIIVDDNPDKLTRYILKLTTRFPQVEITQQGSGPGANMKFFKARQKAH